jgi:hypothetical protein
MAEWQNGGMAEWQKGGMVEWYFTTYLIYPAIFMVHADDDDDDDDDTDTFKSFIVLTDYPNDYELSKTAIKQTVFQILRHKGISKGGTPAQKVRLLLVQLKVVGCVFILHGRN